MATRFFLWLTLVAAALPAADLKVGLIGLDTSHVIAFTELLNNASNPDHIAGARVVAGYRGGSPDIESSRTRIDKFTEQLRAKYGVEIVPDIASLAARVDAVLLESVDGRVHLEQVRPVFAAGKRVFIDKPLASTYADAREIARLGRQAGVPWFSSSSLRYSSHVTEWKGQTILGAFTWGPAPTESHHQLELSWYGIHSVEMLYALMGTGCESVTHTSTGGADLVVGRWRDGRIGAVRGGRQGASDYGAVVFGPKQARASEPSKGAAYAKLLVDVVKFFQTGVPPVPNEETVEIFAFMDAAQRGKDAGGAPMRLEK
jgi:hypothetical protein